MTDTFITQCPHCQTSFRLKHSQLSAARGSVRCGACLQVFNAASQITQGSITSAPKVVPAAIAPAASPAEIANSAAQQTEAATSNSKKTLMIHDDMDLGDLDDLDLDEELARLEQEEQRRSKELSGEFASLQASSKPSPAPAEDSLENTPTALTDWSDELLAQEPVAQLSSVEPKTEEIETLAQPLNIAQNSSTTAHFQASAGPVRMEPMSGQLPNFSDGPLRLDWQPRKSPWRRWLAWGVLNTCVILLLVGQYTYHNFA
ncbi:MAG: zinc-ribbon domain-containing protein, partial [Thiopseudomonas sp.]|nr:zinc-ribbon domain-containing protein [Thiopseudomonas sp.]